MTSISVTLVSVDNKSKVFNLEIELISYRCGIFKNILSSEVITLSFVFIWRSSNADRFNF